MLYLFSNILYRDAIPEGIHITIRNMFVFNVSVMIIN